MTDAQVLEATVTVTETVTAAQAAWYDNPSTVVAVAVLIFALCLVFYKMIKYLERWRL
ncbi:MAG: hypothetical protein QW230_03880 [Thermofilum sp.]